MDDPHSREEDLSAAAVLEALADAGSRVILGAAATGPKTVADLAETCEIPTSTAYRKVNQLTDIGLLTQHNQIRPSGRHVAKYQLRNGKISVSIAESVAIEIVCSTASRDQAEPAAVDDSADARAQLTPMTDGGEESLKATPPARLNQFRTLFVDVTGTEEVVDEQHVAVASREIDDDAASIATYVAAVTKDDGLTDTIDEPERNIME